MKSWVTHPLFTFPPRMVQILKIFGLAVIVMLVVAPGLVTLGWHLLHGNSIVSRSKSIFVPLRWIAETDDAMGISMTKLPLTVLFGVPFDGMISIDQSPSPANQKSEENYQLFESLYWNLAGANAIISGPIRTGTGTHEIFCMESTYPGASNRAEARCLILRGKWDADFIGDKKDLGTFFKIIQKIN
jgi:hypothetical protein